MSASIQLPTDAHPSAKGRAASLLVRTKVHKEPVGSFGITLDYADRDPRSKYGRGFNCPCDHHWYAKPRSGKDKEGWEPVCPKCNRGFRGGRKVTYKHEQTFPQGTKALYHTRGRRADRGSKLVAIHCRGCFAGERKLKYVDASRLRRYTVALLGVLALLRWSREQDPRLWGAIYLRIKLKKSYWDELCADCAAKRGSLKTIVEDRVQENGVVALFSQDEGGMTPVFHPRCRHVRPTVHRTARDMIARDRATGDGFSDVCRDCSLRVRDYDARLRELEGVKSDSGELLKIVKAIIAVWKDVQNPALEHQQNLHNVSQVLVAKQLNMGAAGTHSSGSQLGNKLPTLDVDKMFKGATMPYKSFKRFVVDAHLRGIPERGIVSLLILRLPNCGVRREKNSIGTY